MFLSRKAARNFPLLTHEESYLICGSTKSNEGDDSDNVVSLRACEGDSPDEGGRKTRWLKYRSI